MSDEPKFCCQGCKDKDDMQGAAAVCIMLCVICTGIAFASWFPAIIGTAIGAWMFYRESCKTKCNKETISK